MTGPKSVLDLEPADLVLLDGKLLVSIREELGLSPQEMAERLQCHASTLNRYENEKIKIPLQVIQRVMMLLDEVRAARDAQRSADLQGTEPPHAGSQRPTTPPTGSSAAPPSARSGSGYQPSPDAGPTIPVVLSDLVELTAARPLPFQLPPLYVGVPVGLFPPAGSQGATPALPRGGPTRGRGRTFRRGLSWIGSVAAAALLASCFLRVEKKEEILVTQISTRPHQAIVMLVASGLKMPEKPEPSWLKPDADGKCRDPETKQRLQGAVALRGACWSVAKKTNPKKPCPDTWYDAPPEAVSIHPELKNDCFAPFVAPPSPRSATLDMP